MSQMELGDGPVDFYGWGADSLSMFNPQDAYCTGTITTTFTWMNATGQTDATDPPPESVIVTESASAEADDFVQPAGDPPGSCNDGIGQSVSPLNARQDIENGQDVGTIGEGSCGGTRYSVVSGADSLELTCSPAASASSSDWFPAHTNVSYFATVSPVTIQLTGPITDDDYKERILIGQRCTATLIGIPYGCSISTCEWSISGGNPFQDYTASNTAGVYTPLGPLTTNPIIFYFAKPEAPVTITCTAHVTLPTGSYPTGGIDVTATKTLTVDKPSATLDVNIGTVTDLPSVNPANVQLQQVYTNPPTNNAKGITWLGTITTPSDYVSSGDYGSWNWTQLITSSDQEKNDGVYWQLAANTTTPPTLLNGFQILDGSYPYGGFWYTADGTATGNADSPDQPLDSSSDIRAYDVLDSFDDYLMYQPPGTNSVPVPLKHSDWYWEFHAAKDDFDIWHTSGEAAQWELDEDFPDFPEWTFYAPIGSLAYVAP